MYIRTKFCTDTKSDLRETVLLLGITFKKIPDDGPLPCWKLIDPLMSIKFGAGVSTSLFSPKLYYTIHANNDRLTHLTATFIELAIILSNKTDKYLSKNWSVYKQESLADAKVSTRQYVHEGPYTKEESTANQRYAISYWWLIVTVAALLTVCELRDRVFSGVEVENRHFRPLYCDCRP